MWHWDVYYAQFYASDRFNYGRKSKKRHKEPLYPSNRYI